jgi:undecaprenyl-phosphate galactose phosphotransferase/putative colanic acid biosynthesis UDP-glucose lipid carrier transferase
MKDRVDFDIYRKLSLFIDLIIYLTVFNVFKGEEKAY